MGRWAWSSDGIDFDNDGTPEIFVTTGMLTNESEMDLCAAGPATCCEQEATRRSARAPVTT